MKLVQKLTLLLLVAALLFGAAQAEITVTTAEIGASLGLRSVHIRAVGDLMQHKKQLDIAKQSNGTYDYHEQYKLIASSLADADYTIANLETTVGKANGKGYSGYPRFNAPESILQTIKDAGVDFLTLANNHMLDRLGTGLVNTVNAVENYGFDHAGANRSQSEKNAPVVVDVNGVKIGFLSYTQSTNGMEDKCSEKVVKYGINYLKKADFVKDVAKLKAAGAEVVIALPHWGSEYKRQPGSTAKKYAKKLIAAGVDVVLGSHPHVVQPIKYVSAKDKDGNTRVGLVAYSLGNFISNQTDQYTDSGIILDFTLQEQKDGSFLAVDVGVVPLYCWNRDTMIQTISSAKYYMNPPQGMSKAAYERMKESGRELRSLLDDRIPFLLE
ncbi:MAG: CapA family protein [Clostridia bacterium]|nr:CapA family protein [Clostridia bacterium]